MPATVSIARMANLVLTTLILVSRLAIGLTGAWSGSMTTTDQTPAYMNLKQEGETLTGTIGPDQHAQFQITKGFLSADTVTIEAQPGTLTLRFVMKLEGDQLQGQVFEDGTNIGTITFKRVK